MMGMANFTILAPGLELPHRRLLKAMCAQVGLPYASPAASWPEVQEQDARWVLSVGREALDIWHEWGLVQVGKHRGNTFGHHDARGGYYTIMVLEHPGTLMQLSLVGHEAKANMGGDLRAWRMMLKGELEVFTREMTTCGKCATKRDPVRREAHHWLVELDGVGLCDDHFRKRAALRRKPRKRLNPSSAEAQINGQEEMFG